MANFKLKEKKLRYAREIGVLELIQKVINGDQNVLEEAEAFYKEHRDVYMQDMMEYKQRKGNYFVVDTFNRYDILDDEYIKKPFNWNFLDKNTQVITETKTGCGWGLGYFKGYDVYKSAVKLSSTPSGADIDLYYYVTCFPKGSIEFKHLMEKYARKISDDNLKFEE